MTYLIARNGTQYGPYTDAEVRQYLQSGHILLTDLARPEGSNEWALVGAIFAAFVTQMHNTPVIPTPAPVFAAPGFETPAYESPAYGAPAYGAPGNPGTGAAAAMPAAAVPALFPDPPDLPWWLALLLGILTGGFFFVVWDVVESSWLRRVERGSSAFLLYAAAAVLYLLKLPGLWATVRYNAFGGPLVASHVPGLGLAGGILIIVARFVFRRELLAHFNGREALGLRLNAFWTLLFGGLYFQYHFNRINRQKRAMGLSVAD